MTDGNDLLLKACEGECGEEKYETDGQYDIADHSREHTLKLGRPRRLRQPQAIDGPLANVIRTKCCRREQMSDGLTKRRGR